MKKEKLAVLQQQMKEKNETEQYLAKNPTVYVWPRNIGRKNPKLRKVIGEAMKDGLDHICPDEWLDGPMEPLRGRRLTVGQVIAWRELYCAARGIKNDGIKSVEHVQNRTEGKIPLPVIRKTEEPDEFEGMTQEEIREHMKGIALQLRPFLSALPQLPDETIDAEVIEPGSEDPEPEPEEPDEQI